MSRFKQGVGKKVLPQISALPLSLFPINIIAKIDIFRK